MPPKVIKWIDDLRGELGQLDRKQVWLDSAGVCSNQQKIYFWRHETLPLPLAYLEKPELTESLKSALRLAEKVGRALRAATFRAVLQIRQDTKVVAAGDAVAALTFTAGNDRQKKKRPDPVGDRVKSLAPERNYWSRLETPFHHLLTQLAAATDGPARNEIIGEWFRDHLAKYAREAFAAVGRALARSQRELHGVAVAENQLERRLRKLSKPFLPSKSPQPEEVADDRP